MGGGYFGWHPQVNSSDRKKGLKRQTLANYMRGVCRAIAFVSNRQLPIRTDVVLEIALGCSIAAPPNGPDSYTMIVLALMGHETDTVASQKHMGRFGSWFSVLAS